MNPKNYLWPSPLINSGGAGEGCAIGCVFNGALVNASLDSGVDGCEALVEERAVTLFDERLWD